MNIYVLHDDVGFNSQAECGYRYLESNHEDNRLHTHTFFEVFLITSGNALHTVNGKKQILPAGTLMFIRDKDVHCFNKTVKPYKWININFSTNTLNSMFMYIDNYQALQELLTLKYPPQVLLKSSEMNSLVKQCSKLNLIHWQDYDSLKISVRRILMDVFSMYFVSPYETHEKNQNFPLWFTDLIRQMQEYKNFSAGNDKMYELSQKSKSHLTKCMKKYLNTTVSGFINEKRMTYAVNLLLNSEMSIIDICFECGYFNLNYFYRVFKKFYDTTPKDFRKKYSTKFSLES